jgi:hypothetical protein
MDIVRLRFEAQQCHLRAVRSDDEAEILRLHALGDRLSAIADEAEKASTAARNVS